MSYEGIVRLWLFAIFAIATHTHNVSQHYIDIPKFHDYEPCINKLKSLTCGDCKILTINLLSVFDLVDSIYIIFL